MAEKLLTKRKEPEPRETLDDMSTRAINELMRQKAESRVIVRGKVVSVGKRQVEEHPDWAKRGI